jgi:hypothetical protein
MNIAFYVDSVVNKSNATEQVFELAAKAGRFPSRTEKLRVLS